ncbi:hypothetical protein RND59_16295 [Vibrio ruber]|uniref:hypothetical protein n=1 Tax=Vibrio ruber TaxID=184755 RepID=UPI002892C21E|nr:hypothetical protein [Vibrio ruber]WNJ97691.1 hypothetical protein RND59_16295 [Vibrio ruber]
MSNEFDLDVETSEIVTETSRERPIYWKHSPIYWPALSSHQAAREIPLKFVSDKADITILSPNEWWEFLSLLYSRKHQRRLEPHPDPVRLCEALGITAYVRTYNHETYLVLPGYRKHLMTLLSGDYFRHRHPQILTLGLGALSIETDISLATHVIASVDILIGESLPMLQYLINDEQLLSELGLCHASLLVQSIVTAGASLSLEESFPVSLCVGLGLVLVSVASPVWETDRKAIFSQAMVDKMSELVISEAELPE